ncbi:diacylglycerol O-acyltransferase 2 [Phyllosticta citriasiana]|uniref:diacylglycerol O-acyltransferase 2 n=1 Tax=Phyllosticta citriasiana TaxID=595635 RepID=UPI0030FD6992
MADTMSKSYAEAAEKPAALHIPSAPPTNGRKVTSKSSKSNLTAPPKHDAPNPDKSYADAALEPPTASQPNGTSTNGTASAKGQDGMRKRKGSVGKAKGGHSESWWTPNGKKKDPSANKEKAAPKEHAVVYDKLEGPDGQRLMSVKPDDNFEESLRQDKKEQKPEWEKSELTSGRRAGAGWDSSGIRWAPLNVPLKRRLQTLMVLFHTLTIVCFLALYFLICSIPFLWPIIFPYTIYVLFSNAGTSGNLRHRSNWFRRSPIWSLYASYFPARLHRTTELPPTRKYIFGYHPHGILSHGAFAAFATEALGFSQLFPGITNSLLTLDSNFRIPIHRDYLLRLGLASVSRESCENLLSRGGPNGEGMGRAITIVIGGARESLDASPGQLRLVLSRRKGFVKMAIRTGADLVPVLCFGENELYEQLDPQQHPRVHKVQLLVKKFMGFTVPLFHARGVFNYDVGMMPYRRPLNVVVGRPVKVEQQATPDPAYVDEMHAQYVRELRRLWDDWKDTFAKERTGELEIVE